MQVSSYHEYPAGGATSAVSFNFLVLPSEISSQGTWCQNQRPTSTLGMMERWIADVFIPKRVEFGLDTDMFDLVSNTHSSRVFLPNVSQQTN